MVGAPFAVMVNSGSSANLLAVACAANPLRARHLRRDDEVLVPAVCWSTSVWPIVQAGLTPVFVDVDPRTLNISIDDVRRKLTPRTRAIMVVHVLGNACDMQAIRTLAEERDLVVIEDACESLGTVSHGRSAGTHGDFGTYSFYYSHHMTTGEGGMVVCRTPEDQDLLRCLRAHGWSRHLSNRAEIDAEYPDIDSRFVFVNLGYNVRPLDIQGAIGLVQLERLPRMNEARNDNRVRMVEALRGHPRWRGQFQIAEAERECTPAWFGLAMLLTGDRPLREFLDALTARGVENRPIISGNFCRQPAWQRLGYAIDPRSFPGAEAVHHRGFFIGVQSRPLSDARIAALADRLLDA
jgi:CDP-6-deoxy-D-xylo-4-hexulose-3-dehydrase